MRKIDKTANDLFPKHNCGLYLTHNRHKDMYETVEDLLNGEDKPDDWATKTSRERAIKNDELWELQWYPDTPVGFHRIYAATLEEVLKAAK